MKPVVVGSRELKTRLGRYLNRVRRGDTIVVTDRREPVAELRPIGMPGDERQRALLAMAATGDLTLPTRPAPARFSPLRVAGSAAAVIRRDRDERG